MRCEAAGAGARPGGVRRSGPVPPPSRGSRCRRGLPWALIRRPGARSHGAAEGGGARALPRGGGERQAPAAASRRCRGLGRRGARDLVPLTVNRQRSTARPTARGGPGDVARCAGRRSGQRPLAPRGRLGGRAAARPLEEGPVCVRG